MSGPGIIEAEKPGFCRLCGKHAETRPYGPGGIEICFPCGMKDEEQTKRGFDRFVGGN